MAKVAGRRRAGRIVDKTGLAQLIVYAGGGPLGMSMTLVMSEFAKDGNSSFMDHGLLIKKQGNEGASHAVVLQPRCQAKKLLSKSTLIPETVSEQSNELVSTSGTLLEDSVIRELGTRLQEAGIETASHEASELINGVVQASLQSLYRNFKNLPEDQLDVIRKLLIDATPSSIAAYTIDCTKVDMNNRDIADVLKALSNTHNLIPAIADHLVGFITPVGAAPGLVRAPGVIPPISMNHTHVRELRADNQIVEYLTGIAKIVSLLQKGADNKTDKDLIAGAASSVVLAYLVHMVSGPPSIGQLHGALVNAMSQFVEKRPVLKISSDRLIQLLAFGNLAVLFESPEAPPSFSGISGTSTTTQANLPDTIVSHYIDNALQPLAYDNAGEAVKFQIPAEMIEVVKYLVYQGISQEALAGLVRVAEPHWNANAYGRPLDMELFQVEEDAISHALADLALLDSKIIRADLVQFIKGEKISKTQTLDLSLVHNLEAHFNEIENELNILSPKKNTNAYRTNLETQFRTVINNANTAAAAARPGARLLAAGGILGRDNTLAPLLDEILACEVDPAHKIQLAARYPLGRLSAAVTNIQPLIAEAERLDPSKGRAIRVFVASHIHRVYATVLAQALKAEILGPARNNLDGDFVPYLDAVFDSIKEFISFRGFTKAEIRPIYNVTNAWVFNQIANPELFLKHGVELLHTLAL